MKDTDLSSNPDDLFRQGLENLPKEEPSSQEWTQMRQRLKEEGVIAEDRYNKKLFFLLFAMASVIALIIFLLMPDNAGIRPDTKKEVATSGKVEQSDKNSVKQVNEKEKKTFISQKINEDKSSGNSKDKSLQLPAEKSKKIIDKKTISQSFIPTHSIHAVKNNPSGNIHEKVYPENASATGASAHSTGENTTTISSPVTLGILQQKKDEPVEVTVSTIIDSVQITPAKTDSAKTEIQAQVIAGKKDSSVTTNQQTENYQENKSYLKFNRFWIGAYFSWDKNNYELKETKNASDNEAQFVMNALKVDSAHKGLQYTAGLIGGYAFSEHLSFTGGILYSKKKKVQKIIVVPMYVTQFGESISSYSYYYNAQYLEVSGLLKYYIYKEKIYYYITIGMFGSFNFPVKEENRGYFIRNFYSESTLPQSEKVVLEPNSMGMSTVFAAGVEIPVTSKWSIYAEPAYRYALNPVIKHPSYDKIPVNHFWRTVSFGIGGMYHF